VNRAVLALTFAASLIVIGCATPTIQDEIKRGKATLLLETIGVKPYFTDYKISGLVETAHGRASVSTFAWDCQAPYGGLSNEEFDQATHVSFNNLVVGGLDPPDRLYTILCGRGLPVAQRMEGKLTDAQRLERARATLSVMGMFMQEDAQRAREAQHDQAIRDAGEAVGDAIREQGQKPVDCQPSGLGVTCQSR